MTQNRKANSKNNDLTRGSVKVHLSRMTLPMIWGILAVIGNSMIDTFFVGQLGTTPLSALSFTFPVAMAISSLAIGLSAGAVSVVSRAIGQGDMETVRRRCTDSLLLSILLVTFVCAAALATIKPLFAALGASGEVLSLIDDYMSIWYFGLPFVVVPMVGNGVIRAAGDAKVPGMIMVAAALINAILDPIFIFGLFGMPALGIKGAAATTVFANAVMLVASLWVLQFREHLLDWHLPPISKMLDSWKKIAVVGLPAAAANMINPVGLAVITWMLAGYGKEAVAAFGAATRIEAFLAVGLLALSASIGPLIGQNWGADRMDRVHLSLTRAFQSCIKFGLIAAVIAGVLAPWLGPIMSDNVDVSEKVTYYLWIVPITIAGYGINITAAAAFNAAGKPMISTGLTLFRMLAIYIPAAWFMAGLAGPVGIFLGAATANIAAGVASYLIAYRLMNKDGKRFRTRTIRRVAEIEGGVEPPPSA